VPMKSSARWACDARQMSSFTVRDVEERDLEPLLALYRQLAEGDAARMPAGAEASREVLRSIISDRSRHLCVATRGDELVGSAELIVVPNLTHRASPWAVIENVIVDAAVRGGGAGTALLRHLATVARANGCYKVQLHVGRARDLVSRGLAARRCRPGPGARYCGKQRIDAHRLYRKLGFRPVAEGFKLYFDDTRSNLGQ